jgi:deoxyguanosine kinase
MLIVVEGCIGAGKSTVAQGLAQHRKSRLLAENFESNPFLQSFYDDPARYATETEFAFLLLHFHQLKTNSQAVERGEVIADFHLQKDLLYADLNLKGSHLNRIFKELFGLLVGEIPQPSLMICLSASTELLVDRIRQRHRDFELKVNPQYYAGINAAYEQLFDDYPGRKLRISMDIWDFVSDPARYRELSGMVEEKLR